MKREPGLDFAIGIIAFGGGIGLVAVTAGPAAVAGVIAAVLGCGLLYRAVSS